MHEHSPTSAESFRASIRLASAKCMSSLVRQSADHPLRESLATLRRLERDAEWSRHHAMRLCKSRRAGL